MKPFKSQPRFRIDFGKIQTVLEPPYLLEMQRKAFDDFLQIGTDPFKREDKGLEKVLRSIFPITDFSGKCTLEYVCYKLGEPKYLMQECLIRGTTYAIPVRMTVKLMLWEEDSAPKKGKKEQTPPKIRDIKEQEIYIGEFPLMTENGLFIINGTKRVAVSQLHKSPGIFFSHDKGKTIQGKLLYSTSIVPQRGSWIDFAFDSKNLLYVRIDRRKKLLATTFLKCLDYSDESLLRYFYHIEKVSLKKAHNKTEDKWKFTKEFDPVVSLNQYTVEAIYEDKEKTKQLVAKGKKLGKATINKLVKSDIKELATTKEAIIGRYTVCDILDKNGEVILKCNESITEPVLDMLIENKIAKLELLCIDDSRIGADFRNTLEQDANKTPQNAMIALFKNLRSGEVLSPKEAQNQFEKLFFDDASYDLSVVGRMKLNTKLGVAVDETVTTLTPEDILATVNYLLCLKSGIGGEIDDIDHLGNRRVRHVGELLEGQVRIGLVRMERSIRERISMQDTENIMPHDIINAKPVMAAINDFFGSSQLSQFMDQTNALSEITHKRRLSALGAGGLTRERAGFDVRDVHTSHYGRICPIETPEGPNIGLIASLTTYSKINKYGFIETPYRHVENGKITDKISYLSATDEGMHKIAQANVKLDSNKQLQDKLVQARVNVNGEVKMIHSDEVDLIDVSPKQLVSVAASLIPFLEHDDANRALMGSNMQRQAVPVIRSQAPLVGTGMEKHVAQDSGVCILAKNKGIVDRVEADRIIVIADAEKGEKAKGGVEVDIYHLQKYERSNQNTCLNQTPIVKVGEIVEKGQVIADGSDCEKGELALGQNILIAFMPWNGYNYEDSILVSEKLLHKENFTSVHIEELKVVARDTKNVPENITRDLPNVSEHALRNLDESGIIRIGSYVSPGDLLVGKTTPKGESQLNPEEKLLQAIFGEKAADVRDTSLRVPQGISGVVMDVKIFNRKDIPKDERMLEIESQNLAKIEEDYRDEQRIIVRLTMNKLFPLMANAVLLHDILDSTSKKVLMEKGSTVTEDGFKTIPVMAWDQVRLQDKDKDATVHAIIETALKQIQNLTERYEKNKAYELRVDELEPGVVRSVKIYVAVKRRLSVGDKMAGRHGNKGVISKIVPVEEMPYMKDGTSIDIVLNPLGVPSRMNIGQVLETHLGLAVGMIGKRIEKMLDEMKPFEQLRSYLKEVYNQESMNDYLDKLSDEELRELAGKLKKGVPVATPVFDGVHEENIHYLLGKAGLDKSAQMNLYDGRTGEVFDQKITVGYLYMLKLYHLVDEKIHARSIGPYSLITQQPLGGKAQFGGQRFGEMEVWALQAYGAAHMLRELLTVKSDDVEGRNKVYGAIVKGKTDIYMGIPESFKVLINELKALCLDFQLIKDKEFLD